MCQNQHSPVVFELICMVSVLLNGVPITTLKQSYFHSLHFPFQANSDYEAFYKDALRYLGCMDILTMPGKVTLCKVCKYVS